MSAFGDAIQRWRSAKGLSLSEAGALLDQSKQTIQAWEAGRHHPMPTAYPDISAKTGIPMNELYGVPPIDLGATDEAMMEGAPPWALQLGARLTSMEREVRQLRLDLLKREQSPSPALRGRAVERFVARVQRQISPVEREFLGEVAGSLARLRRRLRSEEGLDQGKNEEIER